MQLPSNLPSLAARSTTRDPILPRGLATLVSVNVSGRKPRYVAAPVLRRAATIVSMPAEPDDALITGATRSLSRRLLALNIRQDA